MLGFVDAANVGQSIGTATVTFAGIRKVVVTGPGGDISAYPTGDAFFGPELTYPVGAPPAVPEPATLALAGVAALAALRARRRP